MSARASTQPVSTQPASTEPASTQPMPTSVPTKAPSRGAEPPTVAPTRAGGRLLSDGRRQLARLDPLPGRVRALAAGRTVLDSGRAGLLYRRGEHPHYLVPLADVTMQLLRVSEPPPDDPLLGPVTAWDLAVPGRESLPAALHGWPALDLPGEPALVSLRFDAADEWFVESERVHFHARDPYRRVDALRSDRHVVVRVAGEVVAETRRPTLVVETGLPPRWYLPMTDVDWSRLTPSATETGCQYKGVASYWHVDAGGRRHEDLAWSYRTVVPGAPGLDNLLAFPGERAQLVVDGVPEPTPTPDPSWLSPSLHLADSDPTEPAAVHPLPPEPPTPKEPDHGNDRS